VQTEAGKPFRKFLRKVGQSDRLVQLWWDGGAQAVLDDPEVATEARDLTSGQRAALLAGNLSQIKEELDKEAPTVEEDTATLGPTWALVRV
jgi:hypothetical protein